MEYVVLDGAEHGDIHWFQQPVIDRVVSWFVRQLGAPTQAGDQAGQDANARL